jgi:hypothetical protein
VYEFLSLIQFLRSMKFVFPKDLWTFIYRVCLDGVARGVIFRNLKLMTARRLEFATNA